MKPILAASSALALYLGGCSWGWALVHDAPLMHYVAWLMTQGAVPYRDVFDMNFPGTYVVHLAARSVFGASDAGWRAFDLLWLLIRNRNRVVTRDAILARLWDYDAEVETRTVDVHIRALRRKLGDQRIETVVGLGYRYREGANP